MEQQRERGSGAIIHENVGAGDDAALARLRLIRRQKLPEQAVQRILLRRRTRIGAVGADEIMRPAERRDPLAKVGGERGRGGMGARGQLDQAADHREDVLDTVRQLLADDLAFFQRKLLFVNVGAGAEPARDAPVRIADRQRPAEHPAIGAVEMAQAIFDLV